MTRGVTRRVEELGKNMGMRDTLRTTKLIVVAVRYVCIVVCATPERGREHCCIRRNIRSNGWGTCVLPLSAGYLKTVLTHETCAAAQTIWWRLR